MYSKSGTLGSPSGCCFCSTLPRAEAPPPAAPVTASRCSPAGALVAASGLPLQHASSPSSLSLAVEAVEAVLQV